MDRERKRHTALCTIPPLHSIQHPQCAHNPIVPRGLAKTAREHIQAHASGWHYLLSLLFLLYLWSVVKEQNGMYKGDTVFLEKICIAKVS
jgi:hypothetical protein